MTQASEAANAPNNHTPRLITVSNAGKEFQAVQIRQEGAAHDRLWQVNNLGFGDLTAIASADDLTLFVVFHNRKDAVNPWQTVVAKRTQKESPYMLFFTPASSPLGNGFDQNMFFAGGGYSPSRLGNVPAEWVVVEMNVTAGATMTYRDFYGSLGGWRENVTNGRRREWLV